MQKRNDGKTEHEILQNQFTAYLLTAVKRQKVNYLRRYEKLQKIEIPLELQDFDLFIQADVDLAEHIPFFGKSKILCSTRRCCRRASGTGTFF